MFELRAVLAAFAVAAVAAAPLWASASAEGVTVQERYTMQSTGHVSLDLGGVPVSADLTGPVTVERGAPSGGTVPIEIVSMTLQGTVPQGEFAGWRLRLDARNASGSIEDSIFDAKGRFVGGGPSTFDFEPGDIMWTKTDPRGQQFSGTFSRFSVATERLYSLPPNVPVTLVAPSQKEHYKCYSVRVRKGFGPRSVRLADQFQSSEARLVKPLTLCAPVRKNAEPIRLPAAHLKCYSIASSSPRPKKGEVEVSVANQFGTLDLVVLKPLTLCTPSLKKRQKQVPRPRPPVGRLPTIDHFTCYDVRSKTPFAARTVSLEDQFEIERARVMRPVSLCDPVQKNSLRIRDSQTQLVCYTIQDASRKLKPGGRFAVVRNQFGVEELVVLKPQTLCVPSTKKPPCSEYAERTKAALLMSGTQVGTLNSAIHVPYEGVKDSPCA